MNPADKVRLKQMYLEDTGRHIPEIFVKDYIENVVKYFGYNNFNEYEDNVLHDMDEPDGIAIQDYIEWLENKALK